MTDAVGGQTIDLGDVQPRGTRQQWRRSAILVDGETAIVGTASGTVRAFDAATGAERFSAPVGDRTVALARTDDELVAGARGPDGWLRGFEPTDGSERWALRTADDVGEPTKETLFYQPFVVDLLAARDRVYAAVRRYERDAGEDGPDRHFESIVYALDGGDPVWSYRTDASLIALDEQDGDLAVACNRCPGDDDAGVVVLDADTGERQWTFTPADGGRRLVGDVGFVDGGLAVASHADYRGYLVDDGDVVWRTDLARPQTVGEETLYAYPTHAEPLGDGVAFVTGNTFPKEGRQAEGRHDHEHTLAVVDRDGELRRRDGIGGWVGPTAREDSRLFVPCGQHFRDRDPARHGLYETDSEETRSILSTDGPVTCADVDGDVVAAVEDPVEFHDAEEVCGAYRLHLFER